MNKLRTDRELRNKEVRRTRSYSLDRRDIVVDSGGKRTFHTATANMQFQNHILIVKYNSDREKSNKKKLVICNYMFIRVVYFSKHIFYVFRTCIGPTQP